MVIHRSEDLQEYVNIIC